MRFFLFASLAASVLLAGCASNSGVVPLGPDTFMVSRQAATGFSGSGTLKAEALQEAQQYCAGLHKVMQVVSTHEAQPPYILANFPKAEVQFMCLAPGDPELSRPKMHKEPDVVIESTASTTVPPPAQSSVQSDVGLTIETVPSGGDVYLDGLFIGNAPLSHFVVGPGEHLLEVSAQGFSKWSRKLLVVSGSPTHVRATLEANPR